MLSVLGIASWVAVALTGFSGKKSMDKQENNSVIQISENGKQIHPSLQPLYMAPGKGKDYDFSGDHLFVKLTNAQTGGLCTLTEDHLKPGFDLGLHLHRKHTEIFIVLEGEIQFTLGDQSITAVVGGVVYIPPGTPHAVKSQKGGKLAMFYAPGGFEDMLEDLEQQSLLQKVNPFSRAKLKEKHDVVEL